MEKKVALITGITGQDGSYLAEFLIEKGYEVHGLLRRSSSFNTGRIEHLYLDEWVRDMKKSRLVNLHWADMTDSSSLIRIIGETKPSEIYNLAAQSHVKVSFDVPEYTADTDVFWKLCEYVVWNINAASIRQAPPSFLERCKRFRRVKPLLFIPVLHILLPNSMVFGL